MKFAILSQFLALSSASVNDFPAFDSFHAHCALSTTFTANCADTFAALDNSLKNFDDSPAAGTYTFKEDGANSYVWATRLTRSKQYTDDVIFEISN